MGRYTCVSNDEWSPITALRNERAKFPTRNLSQYEWGRGERKTNAIPCVSTRLLSLSLSLSLPSFHGGWGERRRGLRTYPSILSLSLSLQIFSSFLMVGLTTCFLSQHLMVTRINSQGEYFVWVVVALALVVVLIWLGRFGKTIS